MKNITAEDIDAILPQTQCGLCGYGGCMPYAKAILDTDAPINLCPPGGIGTLMQLSELTAIDAAPYIKDMEAKAKPNQVVSIREAECIGCTKCIQACPVDAILGGAKLMHSVIQIECTGCELCIPACPVDCIDLHALPESTDKKAKANLARKRYQARENRLKQPIFSSPEPLVDAKKQYIEAALLRAKAKKQ